jgi:hypothetical protein
MTELAQSRKKAIEERLKKERGYFKLTRFVANTSLALFPTCLIVQ